MGLEPAGVDGGWTQPVPLLNTRLGTPETLAFDRKGAATPLRFGTDIYVSTLQPTDRAVVANAPMIFGGYGLSAPDRRWDDFKGQALKGTIAVFLIHAPHFVAPTGREP